MIDKKGYGYVHGSAARNIQTKQVQKPKAKANKNIRRNVKSTPQNKVVISLISVFACLLVITYCSNLINEKNVKLQNLKNQIKAQSNSITELQIGIEKSNDLTYIESYAKEKLGMQKPKQDQVVYLNLGSTDHVEKIENSQENVSNSILTKVKEYVSNIVKIIE